MVSVLLRFVWLSKHHTGTVKLNYILSTATHECIVCACVLARARVYVCVCVCMCVCVSV